MVKNSKSLRRNTKRRGNKVNKSRRRNTRTRMTKRIKRRNNRKKTFRKSSKRSVMKGGAIMSPQSQLATREYNMSVWPDGDFFRRAGVIYMDMDRGSLKIEYKSGKSRGWFGNVKNYNIIGGERIKGSPDYHLLTDGPKNIWVKCSNEGIIPELDHTTQGELVSRTAVQNIRNAEATALPDPDPETETEPETYPLQYGSIKAITGDTVKLSLFNADLSQIIPNSNPRITVQKGSIMVDMWKRSSNKQMFVLASQLNGAEYIHINQIPTLDAYNHTDPHGELVYWLIMYLSDRTGGPRGQLAGDHNVARFIVSKAYNDYNNGPDTINYVRQICNDASLGEKIFLKNGYLQIKSDLTREETRKLRDMMNTIQLLVSENIPVSGFDIDLKSKPYDGKKVHLAYASAVPIGDKQGWPYNNPVSESVTEVANIIMQAQYIAALKAAKHLGVDELFLMPLGGGVFRNQKRDILSNILFALRNVDTSEIDVKLLTYGDEETTIFNDLLREYNEDPVKFLPSSRAAAQQQAAAYHDDPVEFLRSRKAARQTSRRQGSSISP